MSGFNAGLLYLAIEDARSARLLVQREGFWTINVRAHCEWPRVVDHVRTENAARTSEERQALELVALAEPVGLDVVERHFGQRAVEHLLAMQYIRMLAGSPRCSAQVRGCVVRRPACRFPGPGAWRCAWESRSRRSPGNPPPPCCGG